uniref:TRAF-type domain-containing protein n=1 Tax=Strigamia maritima TaxID=126957 RepID=T1ILE8_STRMM
MSVCSLLPSEGKIRSLKSYKKSRRFQRKTFIACDFRQVVFALERPTDHISLFLSIKMVFKFSLFDARKIVQQLGGDKCCQRCGLEVLQHEKAESDSHFQEELCSYCNSSVGPDKIKVMNYNRSQKVGVATALRVGKYREMAINIPALEKFSVEGANVGEKWTKYKKSFHFYAQAVGVTAANKKALLLHTAGADLQDLYETFVFAVEEDQVTFAMAEAKFTKYFQLKRNTAFERHVFHAAVQQPEETADVYVTRLIQLTKVKIDSHLQEELCSYCNSSVDPDKIKSHNDVCDMYPVNCSFCNRKFIRQTMNVHEQECVRNLRWCKYSPIGCQFQGTELETEKHEVGNFHGELMMKLLLNLQTEQSSNASMLARSLNELHKQSKQMQKLEESLTTCRTVIEELTKQQTEQCDKAENHENTLNTVITANNDVSRKEIDLEDDFARDKDKLDENCNQQNQLKKKLDGLETDMSHMGNKLTSFEYIWEIKNFKQLKVNAKSGLEYGDVVCSDPFYSSVFGYKIATRAVSKWF